MININEMTKYLAIVVLALGLAIGCSSSPKEPEGPNQEQIASDAIASAQSAVDEAAALGAEWRASQSILDDAKAAFEEGDYETATELAGQAELEARNAIAQMKADEEAARAAAALAANEAASSMSTYEVTSGDNLWSISARGSVYGDPYQWPLIYKANKSQISDADLIYPGQVFDIEDSPSSGDVEAAINHAKTRGSWSVGASESSDESYLLQ